MDILASEFIVAMSALSAESKQIYQAWGEQVGIKILDLPECKQYTCLKERATDDDVQWKS